MERKYEDALHLLNSRKARRKSKIEDMKDSDDMLAWLSLQGHTVIVFNSQAYRFEDRKKDEDVNGLNVIHVAGTKGKGSTCVFTESFLKVHGTTTGYPQKIGLYTSPHIKTVRERIRIDCQPISEELFTTSFLKEEVAVAIYETHSGGEYDATNVVQRPIVTGITTIGMDHINLFGPSIGSISWHKAGIFKHKVPAFSAPQEPASAAVSQRRADDKEVPLKFIDIDPHLQSIAPALELEVQRINCSLALALVGAFLSEKTPKEHQNLALRERGIQKSFWPGRFQRIVEENNQWFLDGAHNELSVRSAVEWFEKAASEHQM